MRIGINLHGLLPPYAEDRGLIDLVRTWGQCAEDHRWVAYIPWRWPGKDLFADRSPEFLPCAVPAGNRTLRLLWEQFVLHGRVFPDGVDVLYAPHALMPIFCIKPVVVTVPDVLALSQPELCAPADRSRFRRLFEKSLRRAARIVVPAHAVKREIVDRLEGLSADRITVVPNGLPSAFKPVTKSAALSSLRQKYNLPESFVLHLGRREPKANLKVVIQAFFAATAHRRLPHHLVLAGPKGWAGGDLERLILEHNLQGRVHFLDWIEAEDLPTLYSAASCLLFPRSAAGGATAVLEAMACGCPVVCSDLPAIREVGGEAVRTCSLGDLGAFRQALEEILIDDSVRKSVVQAGLGQAKRFSLQKKAQSYLKIFEEVRDEAVRED